MTTELTWLTYTVLMTALFWVPYILNRMAEQGIWPALWDPQGHTTAKAEWPMENMMAWFSLTGVSSTQRWRWITPEGNR